jgi:hypothetical protein
MDIWSQLEHALSDLAAAGNVEVHEDGEWLAELTGSRCEFRRQGKQGLVHMWSAERNLVRRVLRVAELAPGRINLEVQRFGRPKPGRLELLSTDSPRPVGRLTREKFRARFRRLLEEQFPDGCVEALMAAPDLQHSFSGLYTRGLLSEGPRQWAILGVSPAEDPTTADGVLTYGLLWLDWVRRRAEPRAVAGLRLFVPEGRGRMLRHRLEGLASSVVAQIYEFSEVNWRARKTEVSDTGNLESWLTPYREVEATLAEARDAIESVCAQLRSAAALIDASVPPGTREVALRFRGLEFARWKEGRMFFGVGDDSCESSPSRRPQLERLIRRLDLYRSGQSPDANHRFYRAAPERWLETVILGEPLKLDAHLDPRHIYSQVPAFSGADRGVIDLVGVTRDGRLAVIELKASEDIHLPLQAVDYWLRVRQHQREGDFSRYGYFAGITFDEKPPLLWLVSPGLRFHPATDTLLRYLSPEIQITRIGLNETWRRGLQVTFRMS